MFDRYLRHNLRYILTFEHLPVMSTSFQGGAYKLVKEMRILILALLAAVCVSAGLINLKPGSLKILIKEKVKKTMDRIKQVFNTNMLEFRKKLSGFKEKIIKKLTLTEAQRKELMQRLKFFKRKSADAVSQAGDSIEEVNIRSQIAKALFQGDMVLSKEQQDQVAADVSGTRSKRQAYNDKTYPGKRWSEGIHYFFDNGISNEVKSVFRKAAGQWMENTCINFTLSDSAKDSIRVIEEDGCWSYVGRLGGKQDLSLGSGCESVATAAHEIGHALGFFHTHSRYDRDKFITVDKENIKSDWLDQFLLETPDTNNNYDLTYDYGSIMHYGTTSATRNEKPTMVPTPDARYGETLGSPFISFYDLLMVNRHYRCTDACKEKKTPCKNKGFPHPRNCSECICPSGYGGQFCEKKPDDCGYVVEATEKWNKLVDSVGEKTIFTAREDFKKCHYWIRNSQKKNGKKLEIKLNYFPGSLAVDGCKYAGVEIKTDSDKGRTGYRFCSKDDINTTLQSTLKKVPVITYNRLYFTETELLYRIVP